MTGRCVSISSRIQRAASALSTCAPNPKTVAGGPSSVDSLRPDTTRRWTQRSLPEIGRRFGNRDHTTVLHAIRKIEGELSDNPRLKDEIEELKKLLSH